jgi:transcriptional regulator of acetoin/glycerol metabolism
MAGGPPIPGLAVLWSGDTPLLEPLRLPSLGLILGRELLGPRTGDDRISRQHARVRWNGTAFTVTDLGSRNGTYVAGNLVAETEVTVTAPCILRTGRTVSVLVGDVRPLEERPVAVSGEGVVGPRRAVAHEALREAATGRDAVLLVAEAGAGVDAAVADFHRAAGGGPLVDVEARPRDEASAARWWRGAAGSPPAAAGAHGGTLVVHDVAGLADAGQAALATILACGQLEGARVETRVVAIVDPDELATLRGQVTAGAFRDDLWRRLQHAIELPPLRACYEEIPEWVRLRVGELAPELAVHSTLIEACLLRPWPGNLDELRHEVARAVALAREAGKGTVRGEHLDADAGLATALTAGAPTVPPAAAETTRLRRPRKHTLEVAGVRAALDEQGGDLARAAITLGVHRNHLRRFVAEHPELATRLVGDDLHRTIAVDD